MKVFVITSEDVSPGWCGNSGRVSAVGVVATKEEAKRRVAAVDSEYDTIGEYFEVEFDLPEFIEAPRQ